MSEDTTNVAEESASENQASEESVSEESASEEVVAEEESSEEEVVAEGEQSEEGASEEVSEEAAEEVAEEKKALIAQIEEFNLRVNGKDIVEKVDLGDKDYITQQLQLARAGQIALQEKAESDKAIAAKMEAWRENPWKAVEELGFNPEELAAAKIEDLIKEAEKSPEQLEFEKQQRELEELRAEIKRRQDEESAKEQQRLEQDAETELTNQIMGALESTQLPKNPGIVQRVATTMLYAMDNGFPEVTAEQVAPIVEKEVRNEYKEFFNSIPDDLKEEFIGKDYLDNLRKKRVAELKKKPNNLNVKDTGKDTSESTSAQKKIKLRDFMKTLG